MGNIINLFFEIGKLRFLKRRWDIRGVPKDESESSADHAFRVSLLAWFMASKEKLDVSKVIKMSLIHDLCNVYVGEMSPYDKLLTGDSEKDKAILKGLPRYSKEEKEKLVSERRKKEEAAFDKLLSSVPDHSFAKEIKDLWLDYEFVKSPEARFVRQIDRIEPLMQAIEYKKDNKIDDIQVYWYQAKEWIDYKSLQKLVEALDNYTYGSPSKDKNPKRSELVSR